MASKGWWASATMTPEQLAYQYGVKLAGEVIDFASRAAGRSVPKSLNFSHSAEVIPVSSIKRRLFIHKIKSALRGVGRSTKNSLSGTQGLRTVVGASLGAMNGAAASVNPDTGDHRRLLGALAGAATGGLIGANVDQAPFAVHPVTGIIVPAGGASIAGALLRPKTTKSKVFKHRLGLDT